VWDISFGTARDAYIPHASCCWYCWTKMLLLAAFSCQTFFYCSFFLLSFNLSRYTGPGCRSTGCVWWNAIRQDIRSIPGNHSEHGQSRWCSLCQDKEINVAVGAWLVIAVNLRQLFATSSVSWTAFIGFLQRTFLCVWLPIVVMAVTVVSRWHSWHVKSCR